MTSRAVALFSCLACGGAVGSSADAGGDVYGHKSFDTGAPTADAGCTSPETPSTAYPGAHPEMPVIASLGGPVLAHPRFVPVMFAGDDRTSDIAAFLKSLAVSSYWTSIGSEYGVGTASVVPPIVVQETPPTSVSFGDVTSWLASKLDGTHPDFGAADSSSIYVVYYPSTTTVIFGYNACETFWGFHAQTAVGSKAVAFATIARCSAPTPSLTATTSHELFEAATDPFLTTAPAYASLASTPWTLDEIGDACMQDSELVPSDVGYPVQRIWSNAASAAGRRPCVPDDGTPFFQTMPETTDLVHDGMHSDWVPGLAIAPGESRTIDLLAFSDRPTSGSWTVSVVAKDLSPALCGTTAQNGDHLPLTLTRSANALGPSNVMITSQLGSVTTSWSFIVND